MNVSHRTVHSIYHVILLRSLHIIVSLILLNMNLYQQQQRSFQDEKKPRTGLRIDSWILCGIWIL